MLIRPGEDDYPQRLASLTKKPILRTTGPLPHHRHAIAIVGSRNPMPEAIAFTRELAGMLAKAGVLIISGGAMGIDTAAHEAAMEQEEGTTWCVAPNGRDHPYPDANVALFERIAASERSRMIWPFPDDQECNKETPKQRNRVLVGLAKAVVVVQARYNSGSRNAAAHARRLGRDVFIVPGAPWMPAFFGSLVDLADGHGLVLAHASQLFHALGIAWPGEGRGWRAPVHPPRTIDLEPSEQPETDAWSEEEKRVYSALSEVPRHTDDLVARTGLPTRSTVTALLTLSLKDVVVESPDGFYRRK